MVLFSVTVWLVGMMEGEASVFIVGGGVGKERGEEGRRGEKRGRGGEFKEREKRAEGKGRE